MRIKFLTVLSLTVALFLAACGGGKSDSEMQNAAAEKLKNNTGTAGVSVVVSDGVATISGEVADDAAKAEAESLARVEGVKSVTNNVTVTAAPPPPAAEPTASGGDQTIREKIEKGWKEKGCDGATVEVSDGVATARGTVPGDKFAECVMILSESGARRIQNQLAKK